MQALPVRGREGSTEKENCWEMKKVLDKLNRMCEYKQATPQGEARCTW